MPVKFQSSQFPFHQLIRKFGVGYVVSGHGHQYVRRRCWMASFISKRPAPEGKLKGQGFAQGWFYGQVLVTVRGSSVSMTVRKLASPSAKAEASLGIEDWAWRATLKEALAMEVHPPDKEARLRDFATRTGKEAAQLARRSR